MTAEHLICSSALVFELFNLSIMCIKLIFKREKTELVRGNRDSALTLAAVSKPAENFIYVNIKD